MRLQKEVQFLDFVLLNPGLDDLLAVFRADAFDFAQPFGLLLDDGQGLLAEMRDNAFSFLRPDAFNQTRTEIAHDAFWRGGQTLHKTGHMQLTAIFGVFFPFPLHRQQLANMHTWERANNGRQIITK